MLTIELNPQLHRAVHTMKNVETHENESPLMTELSLSKAESSAMIGTFKLPAKDRTKEFLQPRSEW